MRRCAKRVCSTSGSLDMFHKVQPGSFASCLARRSALAARATWAFAGSRQLATISRSCAWGLSHPRPDLPCRRHLPL
eukprot:15537869-Heterocapsa_arctica.AAC.1